MISNKTQKNTQADFFRYHYKIKLKKTLEYPAEGGSIFRTRGLYYFRGFHSAENKSAKTTRLSYGSWSF